MKATKGNKTYTITEQEQKRYQDAGYDILNDDDKIIANGRGKAVPYDDYVAVKAELEAVKAELDKVSKASAKAEKAAEAQKAGN